MSDFEVHPPGTAARLQAINAGGCAPAVLASHQQAEPVAWMDDFGNVFPLAANKGAGHWLDDHKRNWKPLYTSTPPRITAEQVELDLAPHGYAYRYVDGIRFNGGREVNGSTPIEVIPYWLGQAPSSLKLAQLQADLARERDRVANALRLLDDYRERAAPMPTYAQLVRALRG